MSESPTIQKLKKKLNARSIALIPYCGGPDLADGVGVSNGEKKDDSDAKDEGGRVKIWATQSSVMGKDNTGLRIRLREARLIQISQICLEKSF